MHDQPIDREATRSLARLRPRLAATFAEERAADPAAWDAFTARLETHFPALFGPMLRLYGGRYDFFYYLERSLELAARSWLDRPAALRALDEGREADLAWFQSERMMGAVCYVDLFARNLAGLRERISYLRELGITYLHLMPLFLAPEGNSDGGYAISDYRRVDPRLGTMEDLADLAAELRANGISLVLDFVFDHTSDEHPWARQAIANPDDEDANAYLMFPDRSLPDAYERTLRDIFPEQRPGSFTWRPDAARWVWTNFNSFQ